MPNTDIYKSREPMPIGGNKPPKKGRRRRSKSKRAFDEESSRRRRSKNSGLRRLLHLSRKSDNEKYFWGSMITAIIAVLVLIAIWQFLIVEHIARDEEAKNEYIQYQRDIPSVQEQDAASPSE